ncbi:MAG: hypothetical protein GX434_06865 [Peptococcaceae bacterium]|nr:hypothetical protein [Peptococcaceae bacterium]
MKMIYTLPFLLRSEPEYFKQDMQLVHNCFSTLQQDQSNILIIYNQGFLEKDKLRDLLDHYKLNAEILGTGGNIGIAQARQKCFEYIWANYPEIPFIAEIHLDMIFPQNWYIPLLNHLIRSDEPCLSPGIVNSTGELHPLCKGKSLVRVPQETEKLLLLLKSLERQEMHEGFVHPVIHKSEVLKQIGGYDCRFLQGRQGYEDDSLLLGYSYYLGTSRKWKPKCCLESWVYHAALAQRITLPDIQKEFSLNLRGLTSQYGGYGLMELARIHDSEYFKFLFNETLHTLQQE